MPKRTYRPPKRTLSGQEDSYKASKLIYRAMSNLAAHGYELYFVTIGLPVRNGDYIGERSAIKASFAKLLAAWIKQQQRSNESFDYAYIFSDAYLPHYHMVTTSKPPSRQDLDIDCQQIGNSDTDRVKVTKYMRKNIDNASFADSKPFSYSHSFPSWANPELRIDKYENSGHFDKPRLKKCSHCGLFLPALPNYFYRDYGKLRSECKRCFRLKNAACRANDTARDYGLTERLTIEQLALQLERQKANAYEVYCYWTHEKVSIASIELDHKEPFANGGHNTPNNICFTSAKLNAQKSGKPLKQWLSELAAMGYRHELQEGLELPIQQRLGI